MRNRGMPLPTLHMGPDPFNEARNSGVDRRRHDIPTARLRETAQSLQDISSTSWTHKRAT